MDVRGPRVAFIGGMAVWLAASLAGCGVGDGDETASTPALREALPELVQDIDPDGDRLDLRSRNYFPAALGDRWHYDLVQAGVTTLNAATRVATSEVGTDVTIAETVAGASEQHTYRKTADGVVMVDPLPPSVPPAARALVGELLLYAEPFHPIGATRRMIRQGRWGADRDGDGIEDSFRLEWTQVLVGFETLSVPPNLHVPRGPKEAAHFRNTVVLTYWPSKLEAPVVTVTSTDDSWWAGDIGLLRAERATSSSDGATVVPPYLLRFASGTVGILEYIRGAPLGSKIVVPISTPTAMVYDAARRRYYAVTGGSPGSTCPDAIASIDPDSGAVSCSAAVGAKPSTVALGAGGSVLYVGLDESGEVMALRLPDMVELSRTAMPPPPFYPMRLLAEHIAVSPTEPDTLAVSISGGYGGVVLIRNGVLQPRMTSTATHGPMAFDADGLSVYSYNSTAAVPALHRLQVLADGLAGQAMEPVPANARLAAMDVSAQGLVADNAIYRTGDLRLAGTIDQGGGCRVSAEPGRLVCFDYTSLRGEGTLNLVEAATLAVVSQSAYSVRGFEAPVYLVPGPAGQVALRVSSGVWLINPNLR